MTANENHRLLAVSTFSVGLPMMQIFMTTVPFLAWWKCLLFTLVKMIVTAAAIASGAHGGLLTASFVIGGGIGAIFTAVFREVCLAIDLPEALGGEQYRLLILCGMSGFFAAVTHLPLCGVVTCVEMIAGVGLGFGSGSEAFVFCASSVIAYATMSHFCPLSIFELMLVQGGVNLETYDAIMSQLMNPKVLHESESSDEQEDESGQGEHSGGRDGGGCGVLLEETEVEEVLDYLPDS